MSISIIKVVALTLTVGAFAIPQASAADDIEDFVLQKAFDAGMSGDTETAMSMLTDDVFFAALPAPGHPMWSAGYLSGKEAVTAWWAFVGSDEGYLKIVDLNVDGNRAMYQGELSINSLKALGVAPATIDGVALLRDGKIYGMMTTFTPEARKAIAEAQN